MLELPESYTIAAQATQALKGKIISHLELLHTPHKFAFFGENRDKYADCLEGQTIVGATFHGGMVEFDTEDLIIVFSDGAYPRYYQEKGTFPKTHQLALYFDDDTAVFVSIQMYGGIFIAPRGELNDGYYISSRSKPNPLTEQFTYDYFRSLFTTGGKKLSAKAFLATEQRIPGLGNGVLQDILWDAGIDPRFDMQQAKEDDFHALYDSVRKILKEMCEHGGRNTEKDLFGHTGDYITQLSKNSLGNPCMKCGYEIQKASYMGGAVYFCEHCQKRAVQ